MSEESTVTDAIGKYVAEASQQIIILLDAILHGHLVTAVASVKQNVASCHMKKGTYVLCHCRNHS